LIYIWIAIRFGWIAIRFGWKEMPAKAIESFVEENPGRTATQIAEALYGVKGYHQRVSGTLRLLSDLGRIERRGSGGPGDPFRYFVAQNRPAPTANTAIDLTC
jgi:hypothetical protein